MILDDIHQPLQPTQDFLITSLNRLMKCGRLTSPCLRLNTWAGAPWVVEFAVGGWSQSWGVDGEAERTCGLEPSCGEEDTNRRVSLAGDTGTHRSCSKTMSMNQGKTQPVGLVNMCPREKGPRRCQGWWKEEPRAMSFTRGHHRHNTDLHSLSPSIHIHSFYKRCSLVARWREKEETKQLLPWKFYAICTIFFFSTVSPVNNTQATTCPWFSCYPSSQRSCRLSHLPMQSINCWGTSFVTGLLRS